MSSISDYRLRITLPRDRRFLSRGVPVVELSVSGRDYMFHRVSGICDSGSSRTYLCKTTYERLGLTLDKNTDHLYPSNGLTHQILYKPQELHLRIDSVRPPVHLVVHGGLVEEIEENLFGADLIDYFDLMITPQSVILLGDAISE